MLSRNQNNKDNHDDNDDSSPPNKKSRTNENEVIKINSTANNLSDTPKLNRKQRRAHLQNNNNDNNNNNNNNPLPLNNNLNHSNNDKGLTVKGNDNNPNSTNKKKNNTKNNKNKNNLLGNHQFTQSKNIKHQNDQQEEDSQNQVIQSNELFIKFLPRDTTEEELKKIFNGMGPIEKVVLQRHYSDGLCKGSGWVTFENVSSAQRAFKVLNGYHIRGRHIEISQATFRRERPHMQLTGTQQEIGTHSPAMLNEIIGVLILNKNNFISSNMNGIAQKNGIFIDGTFGRGGHSFEIFRNLDENGSFHCFDMDPEAIAVAEEFKSKLSESSRNRFNIHPYKFSKMKKVLKHLKGQVTGILLDLGISSPQLDDPTRGMRPEHQGPLDLRYDTAKGEPAFSFLQRATREEIMNVIAAYGDGQDSATAIRVADALVLNRDFGETPLAFTTQEFGSLVTNARCGGDYQPMHAAKLTFQALRLYLNNEREELVRGLEASFDLLAEGGRICILTWKHSECAIVMDFLRKYELAPSTFPLRQWWERGNREPLEENEFGLIRAEAKRASSEELRVNARARSAVLHILYKHKGVRVQTVQDAVYKELGWDSITPAFVDKGH